MRCSALSAWCINRLVDRHLCYASGVPRKKTDIRGSDLDVYVMTPEAMTCDGQKRLVKELRLEFGQQHVSAYDVYQKVTLPCGNKMDVQPHHATFLNDGNVKALPHNRFWNNKKGREAVRLLKVLAKKKKYQWGGRLIEMGVLSFQQAHKAATNIEIRDAMVRVLNKATALPANRRESQMREQIQETTRLRDRAARGTKQSVFLCDSETVSKQFKETATCVSTSGKATVMLYEGGGWAHTAGVPRHLYDKLNERASSPTYVSIGARAIHHLLSPSPRHWTADRCYVKFANGASQWVGPDPMSNVLKTESRSVRSVAFGATFDSFLSSSPMAGGLTTTFLLDLRLRSTHVAGDQISHAFLLVLTVNGT